MTGAGEPFGVEQLDRALTHFTPRTNDGDTTPECMAPTSDSLVPRVPNVDSVVARHDPPSRPNRRPRVLELG
jgi:hypothetical protein